MKEDKPKEACGVFGVYAPGEDVSRLCFFGLFALQHRGQESAGIAVGDGKTLKLHKAMGLASQVFDEEILSNLKGFLGIGHVRYSTTGTSSLYNAQPIIAEGKRYKLALAHNGNLINSLLLRNKLQAAGESFEGSSDSELIAKLIARSDNSKIEIAIKEIMTEELEGAYSLVLATPKQLIGVRDPCGIRPLCLGRLNSQQWVIASETCALNVVGAKFVREIEPGEIIIIEDGTVSEFQAVAPKRRSMCIFEFIYFARPDSHIYAKSLHMARRKMGHMLYQEHPVEADLVIPVPDTGIPAAIGFAEASKIPFGEGLIKNRYIHRTFIQPDQRLRELGVKMKLTPLKEALLGKRVVVVEDSIVRGTTTKAIINLLKDAGAKQVHLRISSPPYKYPCYYGIDTMVSGELLASKLSVEEIRQFIGADSLGYLSFKGLIKAIGISKNNFCLACFNNNYPIELPPDIKLSKYALEGVPPR